MKPPIAQSATSLPRAPRDEAQGRMRRYFLMMSVRVVCFVLMMVITPYGWYTWVLALGAIVLPYVAVIIANVAVSGQESRAVAPERALPAPAPPVPPAASTQTIRVHETRPLPKADPS